ncbi:MAG: DUF47 family protein [Candidatus Marinimicrobia bacterium]|nr:DUF47 family protein [Candidatus Neomarinimicrobiota bacterium]
MLKKTKQLERKVNNFMDIVNETGPTLLLGIKAYFKGDMDKFYELSDKMVKLENRADEIKRNIESELYERTLIPESRSDVLSLLEALDDIVDRGKETIQEFDMEIPQISPRYHEGFLNLTELSANAIDQVVKAARNFFNNSVESRHYFAKVYYWEKEADRESGRLIKKIFRDERIEDLSCKFHHRSFVERLDRVADIAEDIADKLSILSIKRSI